MEDTVRPVDSPRADLPPASISGTRTRLKRERKKAWREYLSDSDHLSPFLSVFHSFFVVSFILVSRSLCTCRCLFADFPLLLSRYIYCRLPFVLLTLFLFSLALGNSQAIHPRMHEMTMMMMPGTRWLLQHAGSKRSLLFRLLARDVIVTRVQKCTVIKFTWREKYVLIRLQHTGAPFSISNYCSYSIFRLHKNVSQYTSYSRRYL